MGNLDSGVASMIPDVRAAIFIPRRSVDHSYKPKPCPFHERHRLFLMRDSLGFQAVRLLEVLSLIQKVVISGINTQESD
jgi:hypothetical protein